MVPFESLGSVCYSPSIVTMTISFAISVAVSVAVCEIFCVRELRDLENRVRVRSRSLEMAYEFLFTYHSNYGAILNRLRDIATYW